MAKTIGQEFVKGLWDEIPPFRLVLGLCPTLAVTKAVENGIGMGLATTFVLVCANLLVSILSGVIPSKIRIACYIIIIATFVTVVELVMQAYTYELFMELGIFIPLIVVNCIVLGRLEAHAMSNPVPSSFLDGIGNGIGYALILLIVGFFRELFGSGTLLGYQVIPQMLYDAGYVDNGLMVLAPGAFIILALTIWLQRTYTGYKEEE